MRVNEDIRASQEESDLHSASRALLQEWELRRAGASAMGRRDLDLAQLRQLLPCLFVAERHPASGGFAWRLAGTAICAMFNREVTGSDLLSGWDMFERGVIQRFLAAVVQHHRPAAIRLRFHTDREQAISAEMLAVPMLAADGAATHVLGGLFPFRGPALQHYSEIIRFDLVGARFLGGGGATACLSSAQATQTQARRKFRVISGGLDPS